MTTVEEQRTFVRPDGKEKVTGTGRYTADLSLTGQLHAKFRYADHTHARIMRIDATKARALPGVLAVVTHEDVPDVLYGGMVQDRRLFAKEKVRFEGDIVAGVAALTPEIAARGRRADRGRLRAAAPRHATSTPRWRTTPRSFTPSGSRTGPRRHSSARATGSATRRSSRATPKRRWRAPTSSSRAATSPTLCRESRSSRAQSSPSGRETASPSGRRHRCRTPHAPEWRTTLQIPESHVRVIVPLLGGGFGAKCDFHFEGHVAALARAAGRPVKLVFSRQEEFVAVGHRREGMVIELETGARKDGKLVARRGRLVLDKGAYCGEGGFFAQMAAMHALGPYEIETVNLESFLNYSNNQPSSSIRAPTAPQVCWALEQHMDELAEALGLDPVELRRRTLIEEGSETPTGQKLERIAMKETLEKAVELIGYGRELPPDEAIGVACGWWPCFAVERRAHTSS